MKKLLQRISALTLVCALAVTLIGSAFAASDSKPVNGYGNFSASLVKNNSGKVVCSTSVTSNTDGAHLTYTVQYMNKLGATLLTTSGDTSDYTNAIAITSITTPPVNAYSVYSAHGVQGGKTYSAQVIYLKLVL